MRRRWRRLHLVWKQPGEPDTGWSNDPVSNRLSEAIYIQDEKDGLLISPTMAPLKSAEEPILRGMASVTAYSNVTPYSFGWNCCRRCPWPIA